MELSLIQSILFGLVSGVTDILPVSAEAHKLLLLQLFGVESEPALLRLIIHLAVLVGLYFGCQNHLQRIFRQYRLRSRTHRRGKKSADIRSQLDLKFVRTAIIPLIIGLVFFSKVRSLSGSLLWVALFLVVNGIILYLPAVFPAGNKDSRSMAPLDGISVGAAGAVGILPGVSPVGCVSSMIRLRGGDRLYAVNMALILQMLFTIGMIVHDVIFIGTYGMEAVRGITLVSYLVAAAAAFAGAFLAVRLLRMLASSADFTWMSFYCWGIGFFSFVIYLMV